MLFDLSEISILVYKLYVSTKVVSNFFSSELERELLVHAMYAFVFFF